MTAKLFFTQTLPATLKLAAVNTWRYIKQAKVELIVLFAVLAIDLIVKYIVENAALDIFAQTGQLGGINVATVIPNFFYIRFTYNPDMGLSLRFFDNPLHRLIFFTIFTVIATTAFFAAMVWFRKSHWLARVCFALIIAGALGNFYDRLFTIIPDNFFSCFTECRCGINGVRDMFAFTIGGRPMPIFNIADVALVLGVIVFAVYFIFIYKSPPPPLVGPVWPEDLEKNDIIIATANKNISDVDSKKASNNSVIKNENDDIQDDALKDTIGDKQN